MRDIFAGVQRKNRAIWLVAILLATYNVFRLLFIVAVPYSLDQIAHLDVGISASEYQVAFQNYLNEESPSMHMSPDSLKMIIISSGAMAAGYIIFSFLLGIRKKIAKYIVVSLITIELLIDMYLGIKYGILPSKNSIVMAIFLLLFLFSPHISKEFK